MNHMYKVGSKWLVTDVDLEENCALYKDSNDLKNSGDFDLSDDTETHSFYEITITKRYEVKTDVTFVDVDAKAKK